MTIKYGELTIIKEKEQSNLEMFVNWLTNEEKVIEKSKYIFLFDDGEIRDFEDKLLVDYNFSFRFRYSGYISRLPVYFLKYNDFTTELYFNKLTGIYETIIPDSLLCFNQIFISYSKYRYDIIIPSVYNCIYFCNKSLLLSPEIFGLIRIKSSEQMPRFQFAYDSEEFTREETIYLIHRILNS